MGAAKFWTGRCRKTFAYDTSETRTFKFRWRRVAFFVWYRYSAELQVLHQTIESIREQQTTITHSIEHQLTYTKELDENVRQNTQDVTLLARILKLEVGNLMKLNETGAVVEERLMNRLDRMANASQTIRELEFFSLQLEQEFIKIRHGLDVTSTGKLSAELLPPPQPVTNIATSCFAVTRWCITIVRN